MSVTNESNKVSYAANVNGVYPIPFFFTDNTDVKLYVNDVLYTLNTQYSVTGAGNPSGGTLTIIGGQPVGATITILRKVPLNQPNSFTENGPFQAKTLEGMFDKAAHISQQQQEEINRAVKFPFTSTVSPQLTGTAVPNTMIVVNPAGDGLAFGPSYTAFSEDVDVAVLAAQSAAEDAAASVTLAAGHATNASTVATTVATAVSNTLGTQILADAQDILDLTDAARIAAENFAVAADSTSQDVQGFLADAGTIRDETATIRDATLELRSQTEIIRNQAALHRDDAEAAALNAIEAALDVVTQDMTGDDTDLAPSVAAVKSYVASNIPDLTDDNITVTANGLNKTLSQAIIDEDLGGAGSDTELVMTTMQNKTLSQALADGSFHKGIIPYPQMTDWTTYTPTPANAQAVSGSNGRYRRVGDMLEVAVRFNFNGAGANTPFTFTLPPGLTIDETKLTHTASSTSLNDGNGSHGQAFWHDAGIGYKLGSVLAYSSTTLGIVIDNAGTWFNMSLAATGDSLGITARIPIVGWTSSSPTLIQQTETFSTDTAPLAYASSSQYTLATLANAPVGTFITFTYAANTNTRTQTTTAPTQTIADMTTNGILVYPRAFHQTSTSAVPCAFAIQMGKGLKGVTTSLYKSAGKTTSGSLDKVVASSTSEFGVGYNSYNESTGILIFDAGISFLGAGTPTTTFAFSDATTQASGYLTINGSKNPALTGIVLNTVSVIARSAASTAVSNTVETIIPYATIEEDNQAIYVPAVGATIKTAGRYRAEIRATTVSTVYSTAQAFILYLYVGTTRKARATRYGTGVSVEINLDLSKELRLNVGDVVIPKMFSTVATTLNGLDYDNYFTLTRLGD